MVKFVKVIYLVALASTLSACQKAKMKSVRPAPTYTQQVAPMPQAIQQTPPAVLPGQDQSQDQRHTEIIVQPDIHIGPDPKLPDFQPSPATPIEDDGQPLDEDIFSQNSQPGIQTNVQNTNVVEWFEQPYVDAVLSKCGEECPPVVVPTPPIEKGPKKDERLTCEVIKLDSKPKTNKLDILFVVDTSASLKEERAQIAAQMGSFIDRLAKNVDYQIAVMPAHGPSAKEDINNFHGQIFYDHDERVISYKNAKDKAAVVEALKKKMSMIPTDKTAAQGETGLLSLYTAVTSKQHRALLAEQGFMRNDAALAVIFIADEQDACYDYNRGGTPNFDGSGKRDPKEQQTYDSVCKIKHKTKGSVQLQPEYVYHVLNLLKGNMPLIITGVVYTSDNIPKKSDQYAKENEKGRGYLDLIQMSGGQAVDMNSSFGASLAQLGNFSQFKMAYDNTFECKTNIDPLEINGGTLQAVVTDSKDNKLATFKAADGSARADIVTGKDGQPDHVRMTLSERFQKVAQPGAKIKMTFIRAED